MLKLYRRHTTACPHRAQSYRRCGCPIYAKGTLNRTYVRMSLDQTDWEAATGIVTGWVKAGAVGQILDPRSRTVQETIVDFMADVDSRGLTKETKKKYKNLLAGRMQEFARASGALMLADWTLDTVTKFRATWKDAPLTKSKTQERLIYFFEWCAKRKFIDTNVADGLSPIKVPPSPTLPFTNNELTAVMNKVDTYRGEQGRLKLKAFVLLLRWTGLRIRDVVTMEWSRIQDDKVFLYTQKTGVPVCVPVPPEVITAVDALPKQGTYLFWSGQGLPESQVSNWQRALRKVFRRAGIYDGHAHRFRDTFAVECLMAGVDIQDVAILLGHSSVKTTERHYSPWVKARQLRLESAVQRTWPAVGVSAPGGS